MFPVVYSQGDCVPCELATSPCSPDRFVTVYGTIALSGSRKGCSYIPSTAVTAYVRTYTTVDKKEYEEFAYSLGSIDLSGCGVISKTLTERVTFQFLFWGITGQWLPNGIALQWVDPQNHGVYVTGALYANSNTPINVGRYPSFINVNASSWGLT